MSIHSSSSGSLVSAPAHPPDSPGSSVSARLQEEYDELLKFAVVVPDYRPKEGHGRGKLLDGRGKLLDGRPNNPEGRSVFHRDDNVTGTGPQSQRPAGLMHDLGQARRQEAEERESWGERTPRAEEDNSRDSGPRLPDFGPSPIDCQDPQDPACDSFSQRLRAQTRDVPNGGQGFMPIFPESGFGPGTDTVYRMTVDRDTSKMESLMDEWCLDLKRNVLGEFSQAKISIEERCRGDLHAEKERHSKERTALVKELDEMKEFLLVHQQTLDRKDAIISNLTHAVYKGRDKVDLIKAFCNWRIQHNDARTETFTLCLAAKHHERSLSRRVLSAWFSLIHSRWRHRVEKGCQVKAQEVCMQITADYEAKIAALNESLESARAEVQHLHAQREKYEETMKKAFMRGVCALNMEAMSVFHGDEEADPRLQNTGGRHNEGDYPENFSGHYPDKGSAVSKTIPHDVVRESVASDPAPPKVVTSQGSRSVVVNTASRQASSTKQSSCTTTSQKSRAPPKVTFKGVDSGRQTGGRSVSPTPRPPMASVVVERHHPVNKQTIGQATAIRFQKTSADSDKFRRLAGQDGQVNPLPPLQTVTVVE